MVTKHKLRKRQWMSLIKIVTSCTGCLLFDVLHNPTHAPIVFATLQINVCLTAPLRFLLGYNHIDKPGMDPEN